MHDVVEWVIHNVWSPMPQKFKRPPGTSKNKPCSKTKQELLGLKRKNTSSICGVAGTIGVHVEIDLKNFN